MNQALYQGLGQLSPAGRIAGSWSPLADEKSDKLTVHEQ